MRTRFGLVVGAALVLASLGFSAYGVALAAPHVEMGWLANALGFSEATGGSRLQGGGDSLAPWALIGWRD